MTNEIKRGASVMTPYGTGIVAYVRMAPPDYRTVEAVSVILDERLLRPGYAGTCLLADQVTVISAEERDRDVTERRQRAIAIVELKAKALTDASR